MTTRRHLLRQGIVIAALAAAIGAGGLGSARAQTSSGTKIAADLASVLTMTSQPALTWAKWFDSNQTLYVKVVVVASSDDPDLAGLRQAVLAGGGSVNYVFASVRAMAAMVPAPLVPTIAQRSDVLMVVPNRPAGRAGGLVQDATGASAAARLVGSTPADGRGVGIAILDSGIDYTHRNLMDPAGKVRRVVQAADMVSIMGRAGANGWAVGQDYTGQMSKFIRYDGVNQGSSPSYWVPSSKLPDPYGHGTHVASIAAGVGSYQLPDSSGIAPAARIYDVRVLDDKGVGSLMSVLAGMDWVLTRAKVENIRVMNLSLAAGSTESFLVDPLARAARSATAAGIVVVAAAGNAGKNAAGQQVYGTVGSPGIEPSVITVGASNPHDTVARADDAVTAFSSRGPTRGGVLVPAGTRWTDHLLKPDLVAPGNKLATLYPGLMSKARGWGALQKKGQELMVLSGT